MQVHPHQVSPGENFDVFYFIRDHTDATTYYVQAKIYDVRTGELLQSVNLDQSAQNTRLFIKSVQAPPDPVGYGRNIVAIATAYTDSGYTTKAPDKEEQEQYFLVKSAPLMLGGGGSGIDMRALRELVEDVLEKKLPKPEKIEFPEQEKVDFSAVLGAIGKLQQEINRIPKDAVDLSELRSMLQTLQGSLDVRPVFEPTDFSPITERLEMLETKVEVGLERVGEAVEDGQDRFLELQKESMDTFAERLAESSQRAIQEAAENVNLNITLPLKGVVGKGKRAAKEEDEDFDVTELTS